MDTCRLDLPVARPEVFFKQCFKQCSKLLLLSAACTTLLAGPVLARDRAADIAIGVAVGTVLGMVAAKAVDGGDATLYQVPPYSAPQLTPVPVYAPVYVPVYYTPPVYYPVPVYSSYPVAPMPLYRGRYDHHRR